MPTEKKIEYMPKLRNANRSMYSALFILVFFFRFSGLTKSNFFVIFYPIALFCLFVGDELIFGLGYKHIIKNEAEIPLQLIHVRTSFYCVMLSFGAIFCQLPAVFLACLVFTLLYFIGQDIFYSDIFETLFNMIRIGATTTICLVFLFIVQYRRNISGASIVLYILTVVFVTSIVLLIIYLFSRTCVHLDSRYTKLYFKNTDLVAEIGNLKKFREKVEKVNNEINYQKMNLTKANDELARINNESRSLIEVMKYFTSSFDVEKNAHIMLYNVMHIKHPGVVAFYIARDVYMNKEPYTDIISENGFAENLIKQDLFAIYNNVKSYGSIEPTVIALNGEFELPYLSGSNVMNAMAFPAYENNNIYGVMVVASGEHDYFQSGYSFYESSVMDFTSALISDRLHMRTEDIAKRDGLTKVYNRVYYNQFIPDYQNEAKTYHGKLTIAMMDIDHFKSVNDTYGHLAGDEVIKYVANIDAKYAKEYNGTAVRFGGEEFLLILKNIGIDKAYEILKEMQDEIKSQKVEFEGMEISVNASMGIASYPDTCDTPEEVVERADKAMYFSKEHGRGLIVIDGREEEALANAEIKEEEEPKAEEETKTEEMAAEAAEEVKEEAKPEEVKEETPAPKKKTTRKRTTKKAAEKVEAEEVKTEEVKAEEKEAPKKTTKKTTTKKTTTKKTAAKKDTAEKETEKKETSKKETTKKDTTKKESAKKSTTKKTTTKKAAAKKETKEVIDDGDENQSLKIEDEE